MQTGTTQCGQSHEYACFDADSEAEANANAAQMREIVANLSSSSGENPGNSREWDHWALYYYAGWNSLITDLGNGASIGYANAIWSIDKYGSPNCIVLYSNPNQVGLPNQHCDRQFALIVGLGGGSLSARVQ